MRVVTVVGARPQFVKAAVVSHALRDRADTVETLVHTGQHYDAVMSEIFFTELGLARPDRSLEIGSGPHGAQTGRMLEAIESVLVEVDPHVVLLYGDTNSTLAGALAAAKLHIPIAHVEAGLRSFNRLMPEEINRVLTDHVSALLYAPTAAAVANLAAEGISRGVELVGDVMFDATRRFTEVAARSSRVVADLGIEGADFVLATVHRAENTDDDERLRAIVGGLRQTALSVPVVWPVHPRTRVALERLGIDELGPIACIDPVGYLDMTQLEANASLIVTDSGGVQKEAFFHGVPCVTLRDETEWVELVDSGWNTLASPVSVAAVTEAIDASIGRTGSDDASPYGNGNASALIAASVADAFA